MRAIDVCAGAGGLSLGLTRAGFDVLGVELDDVAAAFHREHFGPCETADVEAWSPSEHVDLVAGGVPCQPFSSAGARKGFDDVRGSLFVHLVRIASEAHARAVVLENVVGLTNWAGGRALREIQACFREAGFAHVYWSVLNAADYGVPQHRRRVFIVGFRERVRFHWPTPTHGPSLWASAPWVSVREALGLRGGNRRGRRPGKHYAGMRSLDVDEPSVTIAASFRPEFLDRVDHPAVTVTASGGAFECTKARQEILADMRRLEEPAPCITTRAYDDGRDAARPSRRPVAELRAALDAAELTDRPSTVVTTRDSVSSARNHAYQRSPVRLDVEQCALLQAFPAGMPWPSNKRAAHRLIGNAVPPKLGYVVGRAVRDALEGAPVGTDAGLSRRADE
jgi:DNA-cytosine methyltransferase